MLDLFVEGSVERISPEAPIPILREKNRFYTLGGAGNVVRNLSSLQAKVIALGIVDNQEAGTKVQALVRELGNVNASLLTNIDWLTPLKTRFSSGGQQLLRFDQERQCTLTQTLYQTIIRLVEDFLVATDVIILSDYNKGTLTEELCQYIIKKAHSHSLPVIVDPKGKDYTKYCGATLLTPNLGELKAITKEELSSHNDIHSAANQLREKLSTDGIIATLGADGMLVTTGKNHPLHIPSKARDVFDVSGAGDTVVATLAYAIAQGHSIEEAATLANKAGGIVVGKVGTAVICAHELFNTANGCDKILPLESILERVKGWRRQGLTIGFTNGCFDLLHLGHLHLLRQAKSQCDRLIVGINTDNSIKRLKGTERPVQNEHLRSHVLSALELVNAVVLFHEDTPLHLITHILPDVLIKGADYPIEQVIGGDIVVKNGGCIYLAELKEGYSTTHTIRKVKTAR